MYGAERREASGNVLSEGHGVGWVGAGPRPALPPVSRRGAAGRVGSADEQLRCRRASPCLEGLPGALGPRLLSFRGSVRKRSAIGRNRPAGQGQVADPPMQVELGTGGRGPPPTMLAIRRNAPARMRDTARGRRRRRSARSSTLLSATMLTGAGRGLAERQAERPPAEDVPTAIPGAGLEPGQLVLGLRRESDLLDAHARLLSSPPSVVSRQSSLPLPWWPLFLVIARVARLRDVGQQVVVVGPSTSASVYRYPPTWWLALGNICLDLGSLRARRQGHGGVDDRRRDARSAESPHEMAKISFSPSAASLGGLARLDRGAWWRRSPGRCAFARPSFAPQDGTRRSARTGDRSSARSHASGTPAAVSPGDLRHCAADHPRPWPPAP